MLKSLYPYEYVDSVFSIDYHKLYGNGFKGLIFDIDNTLAHHGKDPAKEVAELFVLLHKIGFKTILLTDNTEERTKRFLKNIDSPYICDAEKPHTSGFLRAVDMMKLQKEQVICIGDQIFKDIYGANHSGIANILVKYMRYENETKIGIRRNLEKIILRFYKCSKSCQNRLGDIRKGGAV